MTTKGKAQKEEPRPLAFDGGGVMSGMTSAWAKSGLWAGVFGVAVFALGVCFILGSRLGPALRDAPCPPAQATHEMVCGETVLSVWTYKNGGYVCAEYGGVVELGDNCTLLPLPPEASGGKLGP